MKTLAGSRGRYPRTDRKYLRVFMTRKDLLFADETGTGGDAEVLLLAGYVGAPRQWEQFDKRWNEVLRIGGLPGGKGFHSVEFFHRERWRSRKSPYKDWTEEKAACFIRKLVDLILWYRIEPVGAAIDIASFKAAPVEVRRVMTGSVVTLPLVNGVQRVKLEGGAPERPPYLTALLLLIQDAMERSRRDTVVDFMLDENDDNQYLARQLFRALRGSDYQYAPRLGGIEYDIDDRHPGLQAADLYAYVWNLGRGNARRGVLQIEAERIMVKRDTLPWIGGDLVNNVRFSVAHAPRGAMRHEGSS